MSDPQLSRKIRYAEEQLQCSQPIFSTQRRPMFASQCLQLVKFKLCMTLILFCNQRLPRKWSVHNRQRVAFHKCQSGTLMNPSEYKKKTLCIMEEIEKSQRLQNVLKPSQNHPDKTEKNALIQIDLQRSYSSCSHHPPQIHKGDMTKHCDQFPLFPSVLPTFA